MSFRAEVTTRTTGGTTPAGATTTGGTATTGGGTIAAAKPVQPPPLPAPLAAPAPPPIHDLGEQAWAYQTQEGRTIPDARQSVTLSP